MAGDWHPDPTGRHQYRYWDGTVWTDHVSNNGTTSLDPVVAPAGLAASSPLSSHTTRSTGWSAPALPTTDPPAANVSSPALAQAVGRRPASAAVGLLDKVKRGKTAIDAVRLTGSVEELREEYEQLAALLVDTRDAVLLQEAGLFEYRHPLDDSAAYKALLERIRVRLQELVRSGKAVIAPTNWQVRRRRARSCSTTSRSWC
jgi:hypothetical protein